MGSLHPLVRLFLEWPKAFGYEALLATPRRGRWPFEPAVSGLRSGLHTPPLWEGVGWPFGAMSGRFPEKWPLQKPLFRVMTHFKGQSTPSGRRVTHPFLAALRHVLGCSEKELPGRPLPGATQSSGGRHWQGAGGVTAHLPPAQHWGHLNSSPPRSTTAL